MSLAWNRYYPALGLLFCKRIGPRIIGGLSVWLTAHFKKHFTTFEDIRMCDEMLFIFFAVKFYRFHIDIFIG